MSNAPFAPLFRKDFTIMVLGQIASLFGNSILRFALSLYVLDLTGSAAAFGGILAVSMIPTVVLSPFGGILADRVNRRNIMVALDFTTAAVIAVFTLTASKGAGILPIGVTMVILSVIQSFYQPSVQASIPSLVGDNRLVQANGMVVQVNALATLLGPIAAGMLYGFWGIAPILMTSGLCFFLSAVMELFLHIPFTPVKRSGSALSMVKSDFSTVFKFLVRDNPQLSKLLGVLALLNLFLSSMITVGLPYLVKIYWGLSSQHYGFAEAALAVGSILGGCLSGLVAKRFDFRHSYKFLLIASAALLPVGLAALTRDMPLVSYGVTIAAIVTSLCFAALFNIFAQTFAQRQTPPHLLGKVASFITVVCMCAFPLGQALYGILFDRLSGAVWVIILFACVVSLLVALATGKIQRGLPAEEPAAAQTPKVG